MTFSIVFEIYLKRKKEITMPDEEAKKIKQKIEELLVAVGGIGEFLGVIRDSLITNGKFTREEAVEMCAGLLRDLILSSTNNGGA
jgi:hypothetical protein